MDQDPIFVSGKVALFMGPLYSGDVTVNFTLLLNASSSLSSTKNLKISKIFVHSEYNKPHPMEQDIALIKLAEEAGPYVGSAEDDYRGTKG